MLENSFLCSSSFGQGGLGYLHHKFKGRAWNMLLTHLFLLFMGLRLPSSNNLKLSLIVTFKLLVVGNSLNTTNSFSDKADALPNFTLPSPLPNWPPGIYLPTKINPLIFRDISINELILTQSEDWPVYKLLKLHILILSNIIKVTNLYKFCMSYMCDI